MNKLFKHRIFAGAALLSVLFLGSACTDEWDDHYSANSEAPSQTLLDIIANDSELSNFYDVLKACSRKDASGNVIVDCADSLLNQSRVYTLWAPVNGALTEAKRDSLINEIDNGNRDLVFDRFVLGHMTHYLHAANGKRIPSSETDKRFDVVLLNDKKADFVGDAGNYTFKNIALVSDKYNIRAKNGFLHKISDAMDFVPNIWECLRTTPGVDSIADYLYSFNIKKFNAYLSIPGPIEDGKTTYVDSVFDESNQFLSLGYNRANGGMGLINDEDSSYIMFVPTNELWHEMVQKTTKYFNFRKVGSDFRRLQLDTMQYEYARTMLCNYLVFSQKEQKSSLNGEPDSLLSAFRDKRRRFALADLKAAVIDSVPVSNGKFYIINKFPFKSTAIWHDTIKIEAEYGNADDIEGSSYITEWGAAGGTISASSESALPSQINPLLEGKVSGNRYLLLNNNNNDYESYATFRVPNVLSGRYKVQVVMLPPHITRSKTDDMEPSRIKPVLTMTNADGVTIDTLYITDQSTAKGDRVRDENNKWQQIVIDIDNYALVNDTARIDSVYFYDVVKNRNNSNDPALREEAIITFDQCEYGYTEEDTSVRLKLMYDCALERRPVYVTGYERRLRIDCILLIPVPEEEMSDVAGGGGVDEVVPDTDEEV